MSQNKTFNQILGETLATYLELSRTPGAVYGDQPLQEAKQAIREAIERAKPNSQMLSTTTNKPETIFGFDAAVRVFEKSLLRELGLEEK